MPTKENHLCDWFIMEETEETKWGNSDTKRQPISHWPLMGYHYETLF